MTQKMKIKRADTPGEIEESAAYSGNTKQAVRLYERLGFRKIDAYFKNPLPGVVYWELDLKREQADNRQMHLKGIANED